MQVKDDSCSGCGTMTDNELYHTMWQGIMASGREMVLTVEGAPDNSLGTSGGLGNAKRVGHDINPHFTSMTSLVDIGSGLWMFAHNSTNATYGGWWNVSVCWCLLGGGGICRPPPLLSFLPLSPLPLTLAHSPHTLIIRTSI
jgi:hypothetical protein